MYSAINHMIFLYCFIEATKILQKDSLPDFSKFKSISSAFVCLTSNVTEGLSTAKFISIRRACISQTKTPGGAQFSPDVEEKIKSSAHLDDLLDVLADSPYWSWIDLRLLEALVAASGSSKGETLISSYKDAIFSKKLIDVLPNAPSKDIKEQYYTKIVSKLDKKAEDLTVSDLLEFRSQLEVVIMDINNGTCILDHFEEGCVEIHWYIPTNRVDHAYQAAIIRYHKFHELHLQYLKIGSFPPIYNPLEVRPSQLESKVTLPDEIGEIKIFLILLLIFDNYNKLMHLFFNFRIFKRYC